jgi:hypothetical protein
MPPGFLRYYGSYRYESSAILDRAVLTAWSRFDEEELSHPSMHASVASMGRFVKTGARLHVDLTLPTSADVRFAAAEMFDVLAKQAIEGVVEARHGTDHVDYYPSGDDD